MPPLDPAAALASGATVVTPNNRLARTLVARHDDAMRRAGKPAWAAARALPWGAWMATLWREEVGAGSVTQRLIAPVESRYLWRRTVEEDAAMAASLADARGVADLASQAWTLVHAWGAGGASWRAWRDTAAAPPGSDPEAFVRWAERYSRELARREAQDGAQVADAIAEAARRSGRTRDESVLLAGFLELTPQQERLVSALRGAGMRIAVAAEPAVRGHVERVVAPTTRDEIVLALQWARERATDAPDARIGIAVNGLPRAGRRCARWPTTCCARRWRCPGTPATRVRSTCRSDSPSRIPVAAAALGWIGLAHGALDRASAAALFRSPYGPGRWVARARLEEAVDRGGRARASRTRTPCRRLRVSMPRRARASPARSRPSRSVAASRRAMGGAVAPLPLSMWMARRRYAPRSAIRGAAALAGVIEDFARLDARRTASPTEALALLRDEAAATVFQPQGTGARILVLGLLEAASVTFDALWIAGLSGQAWPAASQPNPMLPVAWQRERDVPRSSAARELAFATRVTERLARCAPEVTMSAPAVQDDTTARPTALLPGPWPDLTRPDAPDAARVIAAARAIEAVRDDRAPALPEGPAPGGTGAIAAQSDCPFMATARYRLRAETWPQAAEGLSPLERGQLVHALMASFWRAVRTHEALVRLDDAALAAHIDAATSDALAGIDAARWSALPPVVAAAEKVRLPAIAFDWIEAIERPRAGFTVERIEAKETVALEGLTFRLALDRVDALEGGGAAIVDYKTGLVDSPRSWFAWRPRAPQLGVYLLALRRESPPVPVRAIAYGRLKAGEIEAIGYAADVAQWPGLADAAKLSDPPGWSGIERFFEARIPALAAELRDGLATVTPRGPAGSPCRICARHSLCRILAVRGRDSGEEGADDA